MLRKIIILAAIFLLLTSLIIFCPVVTQWDRSLIIFVQNHLSFLPLWIPMLPDCILYSIMILIPIAGFGIFFIKNRLWKDLILLSSVPLVTFLLNCILKPLVHRARPPLEYQITSIHPDSFSYVSSHSLVTICLWGMVIFYLNKYCTNRVLKDCRDKCFNFMDIICRTEPCVAWRTQSNRCYWCLCAWITLINIYLNIRLKLPD